MTSGLAVTSNQRAPLSERKVAHHPLILGMAGEHLVCADLLLAGYRAFPAIQACQYDVVVHADIGLVRLQVKTTAEARLIPSLAKFNPKPVYFWHVKRRGRELRKVYGPDDFDLLALVAIDIRRIAYMVPPAVLNSISIRGHDDRGPQMQNKHDGKKYGKTGRIFADYTFDSAMGNLLKKRSILQT